MRRSRETEILFLGANTSSTSTSNFFILYLEDCIPSLYIRKYGHSVMLFWMYLEKALLPLLYILFSLSLDSHLGDNPGEAAGTGWRSVLFRAVVLSILLPPTKWFCFLEVSLEVCSSRGISFSFFSSTTIFKIHFFGHFIKILGRKAKHWLYLINHIDLKHCWELLIWVCLLALSRFYKRTLGPNSDK